MIAFVLGNGESRAKLSISRMAKHGYTYGCNAIYRDFRPDVLITVDPEMAKEIGKSDYIKQWKVYTPYKDIAETNTNFVQFNYTKRLCAGVTACLIAIAHGMKEIYLIGHDLGSPNGLINNCYKNTANYKPAWQDDDSFKVYMPHYVEMLEKHPGIKFTRVIGKQTYPVKEFKPFKNYHETKIDTFIKNFQ